MFYIAKISIWYAVTLYAVTIIALILCKYFSVGYAGGNDAAGNGMEKGFLSIFYYALMTLTSVVFIACILWRFSRQ